VANRPKARVLSRSPAGIAGSNPAVGMDVCLLWVLCVCQVEVSATGRSLVQGSPTDCGVSLCVIKCNNPSTPNRIGRKRLDWERKKDVNITKWCQNIIDVNTFNLTLSKVWFSLHRFFAKLTDDKQLYVNVCCTELYADSSRNVEIGVRNWFTSWT
jgi:hypothetical protein